MKMIFISGEGFCSRKAEAMPANPRVVFNTARCTLVLFMLASAALGQTLSASSTTAAQTKTDAASAAGAPILQYGFDERFRVEHWNNLTDFTDAKDDERAQYRFRTRTWLQMPVGANTEAFVRVTNEFKRQTVPDIRFNNDEVFVDNLYLNFKKVFVPGLSLRVGRQEIQRGEGFIISEGTACDGSRSLYFNAAVFAYSWKKSKLELMGILDPRQDRFLPIGHDQHKYLNEWDEQAVGLYYTGRDSAKTDVDGYYFYKKEINDYRPATNAQFQPNRAVSTLGARVVRRLPGEVSLIGEFAGQWGVQHANPVKGLPAADVRAWAGYFNVKKTLNANKKLYVLGGYRAMSGDDPATKSTAEGWDPIFARFPKYGELYAYSLTPERGIGYWTNMGMMQAEAGITPVKPISIRAAIVSLSAFYPFTTGNPNVFSSATHRGEDLYVRMDWTMKEHVSGHVQYEHFNPGDFYVNNAGAHFFRVELLYSFKSSVGSLRKN